MNITVKGGAMTPEEKKIYVDYLTEKFPNCNVVDLELTIVQENGDEFVDMRYVLENKPEINQPIQRLRRITGYIVPKLERWNDGKKAELADRVKHGICPGDDTDE